MQNKKTFTSLVFLLLLVNSSCVNNHVPVTEEQAVEAAKKSAGKMGYKDMEVLKATYISNHWEIIISGLPAAPGNHGKFDVSSHGKIITYHPGE